MKSKVRSVLTVMFAVCILCSTIIVPAEARASERILNYNASASSAGGGRINISFRVTGTAIMQELGVSAINIYEEKSDGSSLFVKKYTKMTETKTSYVSKSVTWQGVSGHTYFATVVFYARNASGDETKIFTTNPIRA